MRKTVTILLLGFVFIACVAVSPCKAESLYDYYIQLAYEALDAKQYEDALFYFDTAHAVDPNKSEPLYYINLIKRIQDKRVRKIESAISRRTIVRTQRKIVKSTIVDYSSEVKPKDLPSATLKEFETQSQPASPRKTQSKKISERKEKLKDSQSVVITADVKSSSLKKNEGVKENIRTIDFDQKDTTQYVSERKEEKTKKYDLQMIRALEQDVIRSIRKKKVAKESVESKPDQSSSSSEKKVLLQETIELDDELWQLQPKTEIETELDKFVLIKGVNIERFLMLTPDLFEVKRVDQNTLKITPQRIGTSLFHLWDTKGRWTFTIRSIFPLEFKIAEDKRKEDAKEQYVDPFSISYYNNWGSSYRGNSMSELERTSLRYNQNVVLKGQSPFGDIDGFLGFVTFDGETTLTRQGVGLSNGKIGPFKDFSIRGWDISKGFSKLSLPGRSFRGALLESYAFNRKIQYTVLYGHDRARFEIISPGTTNIKKAYIQGQRVTYFADEDNSYSVNYARGWGEERSQELKDKVYSLEAKNKIRDVRIHSEIGYDEESIAKVISSVYEKDDFSIRLNFRDIEKDYKTITSSPSGSGEVGGEFRFAWSKDKTRVNATTEIYRDREFYNEDNPNGVNFNLSARLYKPLTETIVWSSSFYYNDTRQLLSPQKSLRFNNRFSRSFRHFKNHPFSIYMGHSFSRNRYEFAETSDYNRNELRGGFNVRIIDNLNYYLSYSYGWAKDVTSKETAKPRVMDMGLNYSKGITKKLSGRMNVSYRNEENAEGKFSFLSGTDSMRGSVGLTYRPYKDVEIFVDASVRNVWAESADQTAYNEADIRMGMRSSFDTLFRWNPSCIVKGIVYRDLNADTLRDEGEPLLEGVKVNVGKKTVTTNKRGEYKAKVKAKRAKIAVDPSSIPQGFVFSTDAVKEIEVVQGTQEIVNFGLTTYSGIYGVVYLDKNLNGKLDSEDDFIPGAKIILDGRESTYSGGDGVYSFNNIEYGRHTLKLDVNSLPVKYLPLNKIKNEIVVAEGTTYTFNVPLKETNSD